MWGKGDEVADLKVRVERLESQMRYLMRNLGLEPGEPPPWQASAKVFELVRSGKKVEAIKAFREESGASLKDAKLFIERLETDCPMRGGIAP
jgi:ribosomal protein L7/L12